MNEEEIGFDSLTGEKRSEEHTSELQSQSNLVCRLLLEKKKKKHRLSVMDFASSPLQHPAPFHALQSRRLSTHRHALPTPRRSDSRACSTVLSANCSYQH